jgi:carotenoid cleavage dioxygenase-like enzyme
MEQQANEIRYLSGNFAPIHQTRTLAPCSYSGHIPKELAGGQYVRNGGNPFSNEDLARDAHWFDGDGMVSGVAFQKSFERDGEIVPEFVNQFILTDCLLASISSPTLGSPILPSIATLVNPASSLIKIVLRIFRTLLFVLLSHLPGSEQPIKKISVANTAVYFHDGRALATCESGPPVRLQLPGLETVGWYNGHEAEGEVGTKSLEPGFGGEGVFSFMNEWTTGHPKIDPDTKELIAYHCTFIAPYVHYSVIPSQSWPLSPPREKMLNAVVPGISGAKMIHDFGVSHQHSVIMDLPLTLDPFNLLRNKPVVAYDSSKPSRFGVFPRYDPSSIRWFETSACCIFHTANTWDDYDSQGNTAAVNMMACRLTSATLVFSAGNIAAPQPTRKTIEDVKKAMPFFEKYDYDQCVQEKDGEGNLKADYIDHDSYFSDDAFDRAPVLESTDLETTPLLPNVSSTHLQSVDPDFEEDQCRLYYYRFDMTSTTENAISHQFALSAIPFEFPTINPAKEMSSAQYIYGCSVSTSSFGAALGKAAKIDVIAKIDALELISQGQKKPPRAVTGCVDTRSITQVLKDNDTKPNDPVRCFRMPSGWYAQEARFVSRTAPISEDDGFLLFYAFDESQVNSNGECPPTAVSELWVLDARDMRTIICRIRLPQRVPYGLHGNWFTEEQIKAQREVEKFREIPGIKAKDERGIVENMRNSTIGMLG